MQLVRSSRRIYDANAVLKLFLANSGKKRRDQNWPRDDEDQGRKTKRQWPGETSWSLSWLLRPNGPTTLERRQCRKRYGFKRNRRTLKNIENIKEQRRTSKNIEKHRRTSENIEEHWKTSKNFEEHWRTLESIGEHWRILKNTNEHCRTL